MIWTIVFIVSVAQGVFLLSLLFGRRSKNPRANRLLAAVVIALVITNLDFLIVASGIFVSVPNLFGMSFGMMLLFGPLFLLYSRSITEAGFRFEAKNLLHFLPYGANLVLNLPILLMPGTEKTRLIKTFLGGDLDFDAFQIGLISVQTIHLAVYLVIALRALNNSPLGYGNISFIVALRDRVAWLRSMFYGLLVYLITVLAVFVFVLSKQKFVPEANYIYALVASALIYFIAYRFVLNPDLVNAGFEKKYGTYKCLDAGYEKELIRRLESLLETERLYLDPELKVSDLAARLGESRQSISKLINERLGKTFSDLINEHRVREFKTRINDPGCDHLSVLGIAFESGFNSKSAFNSAFKKITGETPSEYREKTSSDL